MKFPDREEQRDKNWVVLKPETRARTVTFWDMEVPVPARMYVATHKNFPNVMLMQRLENQSEDEDTRDCDRASIVVHWWDPDDRSESRRRGLYNSATQLQNQYRAAFPIPESPFFTDPGWQVVDAQVFLGSMILTKTDKETGLSKVMIESDRGQRDDVPLVPRLQIQVNRFARFKSPRQMQLEIKNLEKWHRDVQFSFFARYINTNLKDFPETPVK